MGFLDIGIGIQDRKLDLTQFDPVPPELDLPTPVLPPFVLDLTLVGYADDISRPVYNTWSEQWVVVDEHLLGQVGEILVSPCDSCASYVQFAPSTARDEIGSTLIHQVELRVPYRFSDRPVIVDRGHQMERALVGSLGRAVPVDNDAAFPHHSGETGFGEGLATNQHALDGIGDINDLEHARCGLHEGDPPLGGDRRLRDAHV